QRLAEKRGLLVVGLGRSESAAHAVVEGRRYDLGTVGSTDRHHAALAAALGDLPRRPAELEVRLQPGEYLRRDFDLPLAAEGGLRDAVELQLDRLTPASATPRRSAWGPGSLPCRRAGSARCSRRWGSSPRWRRAHRARRPPRTSPWSCGMR
ncbi:MAG: hypothetical protein MUF57_09290, partial [Gammaproteobacteria bacterium]|nr:hypothetical protein [Gammaproteobacteria bacterium]